MEKSSILRQVAGAAVVALPLIFSVNAHAGGLKGGKCYSAEFARSALAQEVQRPVLITDRDTPVKENQNANFFFVNAQGYGYIMEGDKPYKTLVNGKEEVSVQREMCLVTRFRDARLNDPDNKDMPYWGNSIKPKARGFDPVKAYENGGRFALAAQTYKILPNGQEQPGKIVTVFLGSEDEKYGQLLSVFAVDGEGNAETNFDGIRAIITDNLGYYLKNPPASMRSDSASVSAPPALAVSR